MDFSGKTVVVTAAAGNVGRLVTARFVAAGARVIAADIHAARLAELSAAHPGIVVVAGDVATPAGADALIAAAGDRLDVLCNNAALIEATVLEETDEALWDEVIRVNLTGPFLLSKRALPLMLRSGGGAIVNTGSTASLRGYRCGPAYTASKHGLLGLTRNIASAYFDKGIRCNIVCPGGITRPDDAPIAVMARSEAFQPRAWPESADPDGIAALIVYLASDDARHINGGAIPIDAGATAA